MVRVHVLPPKLYLQIFKKRYFSTMSKNSTSFLVVIATIVLLFILVKFGATKPKDNTDTKDNGLSYNLTFNPQDNFAGNPNATVTLIEYSDFQCPACAYYHTVLNQLKMDYPDNVVFIYRNFPLPQHKNAKPAAYAVEAAARQGKFWEMHNLIFENQTNWSDKNVADSLFENYAKQLNIDIERYRNDIKDPQISRKVDGQLVSGEKLNITGTPTFFLNGKQIQANNIDEFKEKIDAELKK